MDSNLYYNNQCYIPILAHPLQILNLLAQNFTRWHHQNNKQTWYSVLQQLNRWSFGSRNHPNGDIISLGPATGFTGQVYRLAE